jgi:SAM-dependent methyltransferase
MRKSLVSILDWLAFRVNTFPIPDYHPIPWLGMNKARRGEGTNTRFNEMLKVVKELGAQSCVDIGCNNGYFAISLADEGLVVVGIEADERYSQIMRHTVRRAQKKGVGILSMQLNLETVRLLPSSDCTLFLSVWHHIVKYEGFDKATDLLTQIWGRVGKVLFFETGESEMPISYNLPDMRPDSHKWIENYLTSTLSDSVVHHLGQHWAFAPDGTRAQRNLFACIRKIRA